MAPLFLLRPISGFALSASSKPLIMYDFFKNSPPVPPTRIASPPSDPEQDDDPMLKLSLSCNPSYDPEKDDPMLELSLSCDSFAPTIRTQSASSASDSDSASTVIDQEDDCPWLRLSLSCIPPPSSSSSSSSCKPKKKRKRSQNQETGSRKKIVLLGGQESEFVVQKFLEESDVNNLARMMLGKEAVEKHLLAHWDDNMKESLKDKEGVVVRVWDRDCDLVFDMKMKTWGHGSVVLNDRWITKFVKRRGLKRGDRIGLYWDQTDSRLVFSLLHQEPIDVTPISFRLPDCQ